MRALVLSGGSIKGAYQAGAIHAVVAAGFHPDVVLGISTGALSAAFLVNAIGASPDGAATAERWRAAAESFVDFYAERVRGPRTLVRRKCWLRIGWDLLWNRYDGLLDTRPLRRLIGRELSVESLRRARVGLRVGAVNMGTGRIEYADAGAPDILDRVYASTATPILMPLVRVGGADYYDGGVRDVVPVGNAINLGAREIVCVVCQARTLAPAAFRRGHLVAMASRLMDIVTDELVRNDLRTVERINAELRARPGGAGGRYAEVRWRLVEPDREIDVELERFTRADIARMIDLGEELGARAMAGGWHTGAMLGSAAAPAAR